MLPSQVRWPPQAQRQQPVHIEPLYRLATSEQYPHLCNHKTKVSSSMNEVSQGSVEVIPITIPGVYQRFLDYFNVFSYEQGTKVPEVGAVYGTLSQKLYDMVYQVDACDLFPEKFIDSEQRTSRWLLILMQSFFFIYGCSKRYPRSIMTENCFLADCCLCLSVK